MNKINFLYLLIIPVKYVVMIFIWIFVTTIAISYVGAKYTSNHPAFMIVAILSMIVLLIILIFIGKDLSKMFKEINKNKKSN